MFCQQKFSGDESHDRIVVDITSTISVYHNLCFFVTCDRFFFSLSTYSSFLQQKTDLHNITEMFLKLMLKLPIILILSQTFSSRENWVNLRSVQVIIYCAHVFSQHGCSNTLQTFFFFTIKCLKNQLCVLPPPSLTVLKYPLN